MKLLPIILASLALMASCKDDDGSGMQEPITLTSQDLSVEEGESSRPVYVGLQLSRPSEGLVVLNVRTVDGTARSGEDFVGIQNQQVSFSPGVLSASVRVDIIGDEIPEPEEFFTIELSDISGAVLQTNQVRVTIENDDSDTDFTVPQTGYSTPLAYDGMSLIWQDEFEGDVPDPNHWSFETGNGQWGWGNNELEFYRRENTFTKDGYLVIEARKEPYAGFQYTSSRMITRDHFSFTYGRVDIRAVLPKGQGIWPALWMLGKKINQVGWPECGEIDIMEMIGGGPGRDDTVHGTAHWSQGGSHVYLGDHITLTTGSFQNEFHVFSLIWDDQKIQWLMDDQVYHTQNITSPELSEFHDAFFLIFNVAVGGNWPGSPNASTIFPQRMIVDYIRVFSE